MKKIVAVIVLTASAVSVPAFAAWEKKKDVVETTETTAAAIAPEAPKAIKQAEATKPAAVPAPAAPPVVSQDEMLQRSLKGVENQKAWIATLEKQLDGEKKKLAQMEADHAKGFGSKTKG